MLILLSIYTMIFILYMLLKKRGVEITADDIIQKVVEITPHNKKYLKQWVANSNVSFYLNDKEVAISHKEYENWINFLREKKLSDLLK